MFVAGLWLVLSGSQGSGQEAALPELLTIEWRRGPNLPQGFQDSDGGILHETLITAGGFCSGASGIHSKTNKHPRGFLDKVWGLSLADRAATWRELPSYPVSARQGLKAVAVDDALYFWGGFNYTAPFCYRDGYQLTREGAEWRWSPLPPLPWVLAAHGMCRIGGKIYLVGGADYDGEKGFHTQADRTGKIEQLGARLLVFDTAHPKAGWREGPACPGTPRFVHALAAVDGKMYVFGGAASKLRPEEGTYTVVDNWRFDPAAETWTRLADLPVASGNFPAGPIVFQDRYVLLIGGYQYGQVIDPSGDLRPVYGRPTRRYADNAMCSDIFVYDAQEEQFGRATSLPLNNNLPMAVLQGDQLHLIGGEIGKAVIEGEEYGHHPDLHLIGHVRRP